MKLPAHLEARANEILEIELQNAEARGHWTVILGLTPRLDGDQYCFLYGKNLQEGIAGFGSSVYDAMIDFDRAYLTKMKAR